MQCCAYSFFIWKWFVRIYLLGYMWSPGYSILPIHAVLTLLFCATCIIAWQLVCSELPYLINVSKYHWCEKILVTAHSSSGLVLLICVISASQCHRNVAVSGSWDWVSGSWVGGRVLVHTTVCSSDTGEAEGSRAVAGTCCGSQQTRNRRPSLSAFGTRGGRCLAAAKSNYRARVCLPFTILGSCTLHPSEMEDYSLKEILTQHTEVGILRSFINQAKSGFMLAGMSRHCFACGYEVDTIQVPVSKHRGDKTTPSSLLDVDETWTSRKNSKLTRPKQVPPGLAEFAQMVHVAKLLTVEVSRMRFCELCT